MHLDVNYSVSYYYEDHSKKRVQCNVYGVMIKKEFLA